MVAAQQHMDEYPYMYSNNGQIVVGGDSFGANLALVAATRSSTASASVFLHRPHNEDAAEFCPQN